MAVETFIEQRRTPYAHGYERVDGVVHVAVDPDAPANRAVVDLDRATRSPDGRVRFEADLVLLRPSDPGDRSGRLLGWVTNRGRIPLLPFSVPPPGFVPAVGPDIEPGDGFLLRRGWTIALLGWQWDVQRGAGLLGLEAPRVEGASTVVTVQFQPNTPRHTERLAHWPWHPDPAHAEVAHRAYPVADLDDADATLTVRPALDAEATVVDRDRWRFSDDTHVHLPEGFRPGAVYAVTYRTEHVPVAGTGLLAVRDVMAHLRRTEADTRHVYGAGVSQTGRFLREFLHAGANVDEDGRPVFDGLQIQVAGARRCDVNRRGAQPSAQHLPDSAIARPPHAYEDLLAVQRATGGVPRIVHVDSSSEYWRSDAYLVHGESGPPPGVRCYLMAGSQHFPGMAALTREPYVLPEAIAANHLNTLNHSPLLRSTLVMLDRWVADGVEPPPSAVPRRRDGTAADRADVLAAFADHQPTAARPDPDLLVGTCPVVSAVGADLNEVAGIRLPELLAPLGAHTGWNARHPSTGGAGQPIDMAGSLIPFPSVPDPEAHQAALDGAAAALVAAGWLLEEDRAGVLATAARLHRKLTRAAAGS